MSADPKMGVGISDELELVSWKESHTEQKSEILRHNLSKFKFPLTCTVVTEELEQLEQSE